MRRSGRRSRGRPLSAEAEIEQLWEDSTPRASVVEETIAALDRGELRVAEKRDGDEWIVNEWVKKAILALLPAPQDGADGARPVRYHDKIPLKRDYAERGVRVVPPAAARFGSFLRPTWC